MPACFIRRCRASAARARHAHRRADALNDCLNRSRRNLRSSRPTIARLIVAEPGKSLAAVGVGSEPPEGDERIAAKTTRNDMALAID